MFSAISGRASSADQRSVGRISGPSRDRVDKWPRHRSYAADVLPRAESRATGAWLRRGSRVQCRRSFVLLSWPSLLPPWLFGLFGFYTPWGAIWGGRWRFLAVFRMKIASYGRLLCGFKSPSSHPFLVIISKTYEIGAGDLRPPPRNPRTSWIRVQFGELHPASLRSWGAIWVVLPGFAQDRGVCRQRRSSPSATPQQAGTHYASSSGASAPPTVWASGVRGFRGGV